MIVSAYKKNVTSASSKYVRRYLKYKDFPCAGG